MHWLFIILRRQNTILRDFSLAFIVGCLAVDCLKHNIVFVYFPESVLFGADPDHEEINWDIVSLRYFFIFLHDAHDDVGLFLDCYTELRVVEPFVVRVRAPVC